MTENSNPAIEISPSQPKKPWDYLTKKQKVALGVLSFIILVLPLSLLLIKTKTNLFPKASFPVTPPVTSPTPTPTPSPFPGTPTPSPYVSPSPSPVVSPTPIPSPGMAISLAGEDLPTDPRITWQGLPTNELLLSQTASISTKTTLIGNQNLAVESGYGQFFTFYIEPGMEFEVLAKELDISSVGSYIETAFYGPNKKKIVDAGTRIQHTATENGPYYLVVYTFDNKQGVAEITVSNKFRIYLYPYVKRIDRDMEQLQSWHRMGRKAADFFLQAPQIDNINNEYITYTSQTDNALQTEVPRVKVTQTCPLTQQSVDLPINIERFNNPNSVPLREIQMKIYPQSSAYYPPGYDYTVNLEYPDPNRGWSTGFSTTSKSGIAADLNDDGAVDISDYSLLVSEFMQSNNFLVSDLNCDGLVDISDYSLLIGNISL